MNVHRNATTVIFNRDDTILLKVYDNFRAAASHRFIDAVIGNLVDQMVKSTLVSTANIHAGPAAHCLPSSQYLDIISRIRDEIDLPVAAYNVSGEYAMIKAADQMGWLDGTRVMMETLTGIKRAGADMILTYFALEAAEEMRKS